LRLKRLEDLLNIRRETHSNLLIDTSTWYIKVHS
jgi:hypothetical protein